MSKTFRLIDYNHRDKILIRTHLGLIFESGSRFLIKEIGFHAEKHRITVVFFLLLRMDVHNEEFRLSPDIPLPVRLNY